jgi:hypothetical protein
MKTLQPPLQAPPHPLQPSLQALLRDSHPYQRMYHISTLHEERESQVIQRHLQLMLTSAATAKMTFFESHRRCMLSKLPKDCSHIFLFKHHLQHLSATSMLTGFRALYDQKPDGKKSDQKKRNDRFDIWFQQQTHEAKREFSLYEMAMRYHTVNTETYT